MKKEKVIVSVVCVLLLGIISLSGFRIYTLNKQYPNPTIIEHPMGQVITGGDTSIVVQGSEFIDGGRLKQIAPDYEESTKNNDGSDLSDDQIRVLLVNMKLINRSNEPQKMTVCQMYAESLVWANGINAELFMLLNKDKGSPMFISLEPNQELEIVIPYSLCSTQFNLKDWESIDSRTFDLSLSRYPKKHIAKL